MPTVRPSFAAAALAILFTLSAAPARAQETTAAQREQARVLYENGAILYEEGEYDKAIVAWEEAYRLSREPDLLYNIANALERLGRLAEAIDKLNDYRVYAPEDERETIQRRLRALEARLAEQVATPLPTPSTPSSSPPPTTPAPPPEPAPAPAPTPRAAHPLRAVGIALTGLSAGTAGAASGLYAAAAGQAATAREACTAELLCTTAADDPARRSRALATGGHASWAVAGALLAGGVTMIVLDRPGSSVTLLPAPSADGVGLVLHVVR